MNAGSLKNRSLLKKLRREIARCLTSENIKHKEIKS